ncbi:hypothetical protein [Dysgonomonas sp. 216]|uniref:hypothetical protein n=1 Tax=Dysgonomonas sp. 216 TaxID=2302934 RepID=UPI00162A5C56|nr:hypothetical protein [Dysgonomonas sp. 216]
MSVTIIGFHQVESKEGKSFISLEIQGELKLVQSENGNFYLTANKTRVATPFPIEVCQMLIGRTLSGSIERVECEPYEYITESGEVLTLEHSYVYSPKEPKVQTQPSFQSFAQQPFIQQNPLEGFNMGVVGQA